jgi:hypothetical protein
METDKKIVSLTLSETEEKALTGGKTRRRRQRRNAEEMASTDVLKEAPPIAVTANLTVASTSSVPLPAPSSVPLAVPATIQTGGVKLSAKKHSGTPAPSIIPTPKILGKKKSPIVAQTFKKPKLVVQKKEVEPKNHTIKAKRQFTARKISLILKPFSSTRKQRKQLKDKIAKMPTAAIRKLLIQKGLMKPNANPPDDISRNMLHDFMMLHAIE